MHKKNNLKRDDVDWSQSKIIFVSPSFNSYQKNSVKKKRKMGHLTIIEN